MDTQTAFCAWIAVLKVERCVCVFQAAVKDCALQRAACDSCRIFGWKEGIRRFLSGSPGRCGRAYSIRFFCLLIRGHFEDVVDQTADSI
jgi:hypothetical protein